MNYTPNMCGGMVSATFDTKRDARVFFDKELENTQYKSISSIKKENPDFFIMSDDVADHEFAHHCTYLEIIEWGEDDEMEVIEQSDGYWVED